MTPKQKLREHIETMHGRRGRTGKKSWTFKQLSLWHARDHWRNFQNHHHGTNLGPDQRPPGWYTGEDAVQTER